MKMPDSYKLTQAGKSDIPFILSMRMRMLTECGVDKDSILDGANELLLPWYSKEYGSGTMIHFIAWAPDSRPAAIAGALIKNDFPYNCFKPGYYGWITDVYTAPPHRNKGLATKLVMQAQRWLFGKGVYEAKLAALDQRGTWFFEKLGYHSTREASLNLITQADSDEFLFDSAKL